MRTLILILALAAAAPAQYVNTLHKAPAGGGGTFTLVQFKFFDQFSAGTGGSSCAGGATSCTVNISAIGAGHLVVVAGLEGWTSPFTATFNAPTANGQTWVHCGGTNGCKFGTGSDGFVDAYYTLSSASNAATTATCNYSATQMTSAYNSCMLFEYSYSGSSISFDTSNGGLDASCGTCALPALTLTGSNDVILLFGVSINAATGVTALSDATYNNPTPPFYDSTGTAGKINAASYTAPNWTTTPATATVVMAVAFKGN